MPIEQEKNENIFAKGNGKFKNGCGYPGETLFT